jgi:hypothetical protein
LGVEVVEDYSKAWFEAIGPFKIIYQCPYKIAFEIYASSNGLAADFEGFLEILNPVFVVHFSVYQFLVKTYPRL